MSLAASTTPAASAVGATGASSLLQAGLGMAAVLGLIFLCAWLMRRFGVQRFGGGQLVKVVSSSMVGQRERVVVVEVEGTWLVLGVTASHINTLHTLQAKSMHAATAPGGLPDLPAQQFTQKLLDSLARKPRTAP